MTGTFLYSWCYGDDKKVFYKYLRYWWSGLPAKILFYSFAIFLFYLFSVLLDLVEAPGAFIMGCHAQHKKQVQRVAAAMDEVIHPTMFFCSSTIEQADIETHHFLYVLKFKWCSWVQFEQRCEGSIFKTTLKVLPVVGAICIAKIDDCVFKNWKSAFWFWIPSRIRKQIPRRMNVRRKNHCLVSKFTFPYRKHPRIFKKQLWLLYVRITTCQEVAVLLGAAEWSPILGFFSFSCPV